MTSRFFIVRLLVAFPVILILAGCSDSKKSFTQKGSVSYLGKPLSSGVVRLHMADKRVAVAMIQSDGSFEATDVFPGEAKATIEEDLAKRQRMAMPPAPKVGASGPAPANQPSTPSVPIPNKYKNADTSDLTFTLKSGVPLDIQLK
ncbi:MAG TPA: hypothetical protein VN688_15850 [Gemmataceae bacterium]|nr:hypothetical protein [Gemmataceae bacterium]